MWRFSLLSYQIKEEVLSVLDEDLCNYVTKLVNFIQTKEFALLHKENHIIIWVQQ